MKLSQSDRKIDQGDRKLDQDEKFKGGAAAATATKDEFGRDIAVANLELGNNNLIKPKDLSFQEKVASGLLPNGVDDRSNDSKLIDYQKQQKEVIRPTLSMMQEVQRLAPGLLTGKKPEGMDSYDTWDKAVLSKFPASTGTHFTEPQKVAVRSALMFVKARIRHGLAGSALTEYEADYYEKAIPDAMSASIEAQAAVLNMLRHDMYNNVKGLEPAYRDSVGPERWKAFSQQPGAVTTGHKLFGDIHGGDADFGGAAPAAPRSKAPTTPGFVKVIYKADPNRKIYSIPKDKVDATVEEVQ